MNSRKAVSIITKICLSSFQKVLGNLTLLPYHFLILARPIWGCVLQYQHSEKGKKASNLSSCLSITGPWRTATEQVLASLSGLAPATKTSPPRHKFSSTRVLWHFPAREQCHTHTHTHVAHCRQTHKAPKNQQCCVGRRSRGGPFPLGSDRQEQMQWTTPAAWVTHQPSHSPCLQPGGAGMSDWVAGPAGFVWLASTQLVSHTASTRFSLYKPPSTRKQKAPKGQVTNHWQNHFWHSSLL